MGSIWAIFFFLMISNKFETNFFSFGTNLTFYWKFESNVEFTRKKIWTKFFGRNNQTKENIRISPKSGKKIFLQYYIVNFNKLNIKSGVNIARKNGDYWNPEYFLYLFKKKNILIFHLIYFQNVDLKKRKSANWIQHCVNFGLFFQCVRGLWTYCTFYFLHLLEKTVSRTFFFWRWYEEINKMWLVYYMEFSWLTFFRK